jgi:hypothetical protein
MMLGGVAALVVLMGIAPWAYMFWWVKTHNAEPLSVQLALTRGEYTSPYFITDLDGVYQIELGRVHTNAFISDRIVVNGNHG